MKLKVHEILNHFCTRYQDHLVQTYTIEGDTLAECFQRVYALERSSRYDNGRRYEFENESFASKYQDWKQRSVTLEMYYGNATVD